MGKIIAVANQKGGVGKTTTCVNLGIGLVREGKRVLLVEADAQGSMAVSLGIQEPDELDVTLVNLMEKIINDEDVEPGEGILHHEEGVDFIPANIELAGLETSLVNVMSREQVMRLYLDGIRDSYDYILIDCMPSLGMITINALVAADHVLIPVEAAYLPVKGLLYQIENATVPPLRSLSNLRCYFPRFFIHIGKHSCQVGRDHAHQKVSHPVLDCFKNAIEHK